MRESNTIRKDCHICNSLTIGEMHFEPKSTDCASSDVQDVFIVRIDANIIGGRNVCDFQKTQCFFTRFWQVLQIERDDSIFVEDAKIEDTIGGECTSKNGQPCSMLGFDGPNNMLGFFVSSSNLVNVSFKDLAIVSGLALHRNVRDTLGKLIVLRQAFKEKRISGELDVFTDPFIGETDDLPLPRAWSLMTRYICHGMIARIVLRVFYCDRWERNEVALSES